MKRFIDVKRYYWDDVGTMGFGTTDIGTADVGIIDVRTECWDGRTLGQTDVGTMLGRQDNVC